MSRKALKVLVELKLRAVSCPGVHLPAKDDVYLSARLMGQYRQSARLPAVFPLLFHEKMTFEKIFRHAVDPGDVAIMLEYETVRVELVQLTPPVADALACYEDDARRFLFPEPRLVPSFSGVDREVLMTRAPHFAGIAPRLEFSTKTTILECSADEQIHFYPNAPLLKRPAIKKKNRKHSSRARTCSPQGKQPQTLGSASSPPSPPRSQSLSPLRAGHPQPLARLSLDSTGASLPTLASWPGASRSAVFTSSSSPLTRSSSTVRYSPTDRRRKCPANGLVGGILEDDSSSSEARGPLGYPPGPDPSGRRQSSGEGARHSRSQSGTHGEWEEVQERVRGLLTTPKAVRRLLLGDTHSELHEV